MELSKPKTFNDTAEIRGAWKQATEPFRYLIDISAQERQDRLYAIAEKIFNDDFDMMDTGTEFSMALAYACMLVTLSLNGNCPAGELLAGLDRCSGTGTRETLSLILCDTDDDISLGAWVQVVPDLSWTENFIQMLALSSEHVIDLAWTLAKR
jgi:hypothetical protein